MEKPTKIFMMIIITFTLLLSSCSATVYKVGDANGWTAKEDIYSDWIKGKEFHIGDSLIFEYNRHLNDVTQLSSSLEYECCYAAYAEAVYKTGHDVVNLTESGDYFFITSNRDRCESGQRLELVVYDPSRLIPPPSPVSNDNNVRIGKISKGWFPEEEDFPSEIEVYEKIREMKRDQRRQRALRIKRELEAFGPLVFGF